MNATAPSCASCGSSEKAVTGGQVPGVRKGEGFGFTGHWPLTTALPVLLSCLVVLMSGFPLSAAAGEAAWGTVAVPLRTVNLNPFHLVLGVPGSFGARIAAPHETEAILALDVASHLLGHEVGGERVLLDGETYRPSLSIRRGLTARWEYFLEVAFVAHRTGVFDRFIQSWHDVFGLPQQGWGRAPRNRLVLLYGDADAPRFDVRQETASLGDASIGVGYALPVLANDGLALRGSLKLPTGDADVLAGSGGFAGSLWVETSGVLFGAHAARTWLYAATLGAWFGEAPQGLAGLGNRPLAFARLGVTWRPLAWMTLTTQIDVHTSPYRDAQVAPLADTAVMLGMGGALKLSRRATLEIAMTEDDGGHWTAPEVGLHAALRWNL